MVCAEVIQSKIGDCFRVVQFADVSIASSEVLIIVRNFQDRSDWSLCHFDFCPMFR